MVRLFVILCLTLALTSCGETASKAEHARILLMGDSLMASNGLAGKAVANAVEARLGEDVIDRAVPGARYFGVPQAPGTELWIPGQYVEGNWDWVILNGYGNDVMFGCGCGACERVMSRLISHDGTSGEIPDLVKTLRETGARVVYTGYLRSPGFLSPVESCGPIGDELDRRIGLMAARDPGVTFISLATLVPEGDMSYHGIDRVHPSAKGSAAIGARIAAVIGAE